MLRYDELNRRANQLAHHLQTLGVGSDTLVGLCLERSAEMLVGMLGILKAGGAYVPLDPQLPAVRLATILSEAAPAVVVSSQPLTAQLESAQGKSTQLRLTATSAPYQTVDLDQDALLLEQQPEHNPACAIHPQNLAYVLFTSGSTGIPKGVGVSHGNLANYVQAVTQRLDLPPGANYGLVTTFAADLGHTTLFPALTVGGTLHVIAQSKVTDPAALIDYCTRHPIDCMKIVPSHLAALLSHDGAAALLPKQRLIVGGEICSWELVEQVRQLNPECHFFNHYGPTEGTVGVVTHALSTQPDPGQPDPGQPDPGQPDPGQPDPGQPDSGQPDSGQPDSGQPETQTVPIGRPLTNNQLYVLDDQMRPVSFWVAGELYIGGAQVARGYLNQPGMTAERFIPNPFVPNPFGDSVSKTSLSSAGDEDQAGVRAGVRAGVGARLYRTGDLARYLPDGTIEFLGRADHQIKIRGFRIELGEIEAALRSQPGVTNCVVIANQDNQIAPTLVAYVATGSEQQKSEQASAAQLTGAGLQQALLAQLPEYMVPTTFVLLDALPLTPNGKIDRQALPAPDAAESKTAQAYAPPTTPAEEMLAQIWIDVLGLEQVGIHDDFFALGGHSLMVTRVAGKISSTFGVELPFRYLFEQRTVAELAASIVAIQSGQGQADRARVNKARVNKARGNRARAGRASCSCQRSSRLRVMGCCHSPLPNSGSGSLTS